MEGLLGDGDLIVDEQVLTLAESDRKKLWTLGFSGIGGGSAVDRRLFAPFVRLMTGGTTRSLWQTTLVRTHILRPFAPLSIPFAGGPEELTIAVYPIPPPSPPILIDAHLLPSISCYPP